MTAAQIKTRSPRSTADKCRTCVQAHPYALAAAAAAGALGISALVNRHHAKKAENDNPPAGEFLYVNGVRLHYVERGSGAPLVLLHGNGSMIQDFESSGLITLAAKNYRVIVFDRVLDRYSTAEPAARREAGLHAELARYIVAVAQTGERDEDRLAQWAYLKLRSAQH